MIIQIPNPEIKFSFNVFDDDKFYYNNVTNEKFIIGFDYFCCYFDENGNASRLDGPAKFNKYEYYYINGQKYYADSFALKTNHLICKLCGQFCKQKCL